MKASKWLLFGVVTLVMAAAGCSNEQGDLGNKSINENAKRLKSNSTTNQGTGNGLFNAKQGRADGIHRNTKLRMSQEMADTIVEIKDVKSANVLLTDHNAYVAVVLHSLPGRDRLHNNSSVNGTRAGTRISTHSMSLSQADTSMGISAEIKDRIATQVKSMDSNVRDVYVSANPDFVGRLRSLSKEAQHGHAIQGFVAEFNAMVQRIFPTNAGETTPMQQRSGGMNSNMGSLIYSWPYGYDSIDFDYKRRAFLQAACCV